jgi:hypothetical protein
MIKRLHDPRRQSMIALESSTARGRQEIIPAVTLAGPV